MTPVLIVHGIWDSRVRVRALEHGLIARGIEHVTAFDLQPNDGRASIAALAAQVERECATLSATHHGAPIDLVGFSMGALVARYFLQRLGGKARVRRFISISGPHAGTLTAYALPLAGLRDMRPGSALIRAEADPDPYGDVEVHCLYTPYDLMIVPATSSILPQARSVQRLHVPVHRLMIMQRQPLDAIARLLQM